MLYIVRGLPGSGKTTLVRKMINQSDSHFEADMYFEQDGEYKFNPALLRDAHNWCQESTRKALEDGRNVFVANTFTTLWEMEPYVKMAQELGCDVEIITCTGNWGSVHGVPDNAIERMRQRFVNHETVLKNFS